jgi:hypothetical protein
MTSPLELLDHLVAEGRDDFSFKEANAVLAGPSGLADFGP